MIREENRKKERKGKENGRYQELTKGLRLKEREKRQRVRG